MSHLVLGLSSDTEANACNERQTSLAGTMLGRLLVHRGQNCGVWNGQGE